MPSQSSSYGSFGVGLLLGMGLGAALGLLLAPKSGQEMRSEIKSLANNLPGNVNESTNSCCDYFDNIRYNVEKQFYQITDSIKAGKMAAAKKREELEEGLAQY